jgi:hypothetical protein
MQTEKPGLAGVPLNWHRWSTGSIVLHAKSYLSSVNVQPEHHSAGIRVTFHIPQSFECRRVQGLGDYCRKTAFGARYDDVCLYAGALSEFNRQPAQ